MFSVELQDGVGVGGWKKEIKTKSERQWGKTLYIIMILRDNQDNLWP